MGMRDAAELNKEAATSEQDIVCERGIEGVDE